MKIIHGINNMGKFKKPVVAMGVFDGVHRGHKEILKAAVSKARKIGGTSIVLTFWPHPQGQGSLYSLEHRVRLIAELGVDICIVINFNKGFSVMPAEEFIEDIIVGKLGARHVYVGDGFRFGRNAKGDLSLLKRLGGKYGFYSEGFKIIKSGGRPISSTLIRRLVKRGDIEKAQELLARPVSVLGTVIKGTALGRMLGFPTANINPHHEVIPDAGIYAVKIILGKDKMKGVCYIGKRPTLRIKSRKINIEVHIFGFNKRIYGKFIEIQFVKKIRRDKKFPSLESLSVQIKKDISSAKQILS